MARWAPPILSLIDQVLVITCLCLCLTAQASQRISRPPAEAVLFPRADDLLSVYKYARIQYTSPRLCPVFEIKTVSVSLLGSVFPFLQILLVSFYFSLSPPFFPLFCRDLARRRRCRPLLERIMTRAVRWSF